MKRKYTLTFAGVGNFRFQICLCPLTGQCVTWPIWEHPTRELARKVVLSTLFICFFIGAFADYAMLTTKCLTLGRGWGYNQDRPDPVQSRGGAGHSDDYNPVWGSTTLGSPCVLAAFVEPDDLAGLGNGSPKDEEEVVAKGEAKSIKWHTVGEGMGIMWLL